jgi:hypothetical protein
VITLVVTQPAQNLYYVQKYAHQRDWFLNASDCRL